MHNPRQGILYSDKCSGKTRDRGQRMTNATILQRTEWTKILEDSNGQFFLTPEIGSLHLLTITFSFECDK